MPTPLELVFLGSIGGGVVDIPLRVIFMNDLVQSSFRKASMLFHVAQSISRAFC